MSLEPRLPEPSENGTHRSTWVKLLAGAAALTLAGTMAFVVVASATSGPSSKSVGMASASASGSAALTPTEIGVHGELTSGSDSASASASAPTGIIATATNGLKGLAAAALPKVDEETTTTTVTGSTTSTTADDRDNDETEPGFVTGTVASISGTGFTVSVAGSTTPKAVTTSSSTMFIQTVAGTAADAQPGTEVLAVGTRDAAGALVATKLAVLPAGGTGADPESDHGGGPAKPTGSGSGSKEGSEHSGFVVGQVTANTGGTLTVITHDGPQTVITTAATTVTVTTQAALTAVTPGATVQVKGTTAADGSLAARLVHIGTQPIGTGGDDREGLAAGLDREVGAHD